MWTGPLPHHPPRGGVVRACAPCAWYTAPCATCAVSPARCRMRRHVVPCMHGWTSMHAWMAFQPCIHAWLASTDLHACKAICLPSIHLCCRMRGAGRATMGHGRATMGHGRATMGHGRATMGHGRATMGHGRATMGHGHGSRQPIRVSQSERAMESANPSQPIRVSQSESVNPSQPWRRVLAGAGRLMRAG
jgi:hypothetical protein